MTKTISILGCGWMGFPLGRYFLSRGFSVNGSTTSSEKMDDLRRAGINPSLITCDPHLRGKYTDSFFDADVLFLNIPFRRSLNDPRYYQEQIRNVVDCFACRGTACRAPTGMTNHCPTLIFASSTSVYPPDIGEAREDAAFQPADERARVLSDIERELLEDSRFSTVILRFAGLYGGERQIGRFAAGKTLSRGGEAPVNLVHRDDCLGIIEQIIGQDARDEIFNVCGDEHPSRKDLYVHAAKTLGLEPPRFSSPEKHSDSPKIVSNAKVKQRLGYTFKHPDPMGDM